MWFFLFYRARQDGAVLLVRFSVFFLSLSWVTGTDFLWILRRDGSIHGTDIIKSHHWWKQRREGVFILFSVLNRWEWRRAGDASEWDGIVKNIGISISFTLIGREEEGVVLLWFTIFFSRGFEGIYLIVILFGLVKNAAVCDELLSCATWGLYGWWAQMLLISLSLRMQTTLFLFSPPLHSIRFVNPLLRLIVQYTIWLDTPYLDLNLMRSFLAVDFEIPLSCLFSHSFSQSGMKRFEARKWVAR